MSTTILSSRFGSLRRSAVEGSSTPNDTGAAYALDYGEMLPAGQHDTERANENLGDDVDDHRDNHVILTVGKNLDVDRGEATLCYNALVTAVSSG
jgi:hypothetical protein